MQKQPAYYQLIRKLDLDTYLEQFQAFLARPKPIYLEGDIAHYVALLKDLEHIEFTPPLVIEDVQKDIVHLKKRGFLHKKEIFEWVKLLRYMLYVKTLQQEGKIFEWTNKIIFPPKILELESQFCDKGEFKKGIDNELDSLYIALRETKQEQQKMLYNIVHSHSLRTYLVDEQLHLIDEQQTLLVRAGFNHVLKAEIVGRSAAGFFYVVPHCALKIREKIDDIQKKITFKEYQLCLNISQIMAKHIAFLGYINKEFDKFDHLQARVRFAKSNNLIFIQQSSHSNIVLHQFSHPALKNPKPIDIDFSKPILLITGVNAGGKTMLLKSLLSAAFLVRYLLPISAAQKTSVGRFKRIEAIFDDPQDVKNDISTFAGRMLHFSTLFQHTEALIGVDEIELGTDSDEAASLFKVMLERLLLNKNKIVLTTHHKRLAALMSKNPALELIAALYDEKKQYPLFSFLRGTIGKSYAFETALRYNIPADIVKEAKNIYGEDKEKLNELIEKSAQLELELQQEKEKLHNEIEKVQQKKAFLQESILRNNEQFKQQMFILEREYQEAIKIAKEAAKKDSQSLIHQSMLKSHKIIQNLKDNQKEMRIQSQKQFNIGDRVKSKNHRGKVIAIKDKKAVVELDTGIKIHFSFDELQKTHIQEKEEKNISLNISYQHKQGRGMVNLDLHGMYVQEAIEELDKFISDSLIAGFDEVLVYHGIGTGKLAFAVKEYLKTHPKVISFDDAPVQMGGFGAKIVRL